jgi:hypothetical protein
MAKFYIVEGEVPQRDGSLKIERHHAPAAALNEAGEVDGYPGFRVIGETSAKPKDGQVWDPAAGRWTTDPDHKDRQRRHAGASPAVLRDRIEALEARIAALEEAAKSR